MIKNVNISMNRFYISSILDVNVLHGYYSINDAMRDSLLCVKQKQNGGHIKIFLSTGKSNLPKTSYVQRISFIFKSSKHPL